MVRRRLLSSSAKQASMSAYQNFWQQQQHQQQHQQQNSLAVSVPQYWHSMCNKLGGGGGAVASPSRRQLMSQPRETELPLQRDYQQTMWGRCCGSQGTLLKPGSLMPTAFPHLGYPTRAVPTLQPQRSFQYQQGNFLSYPAAVQMQQAAAWQQQQPQQQSYQPVPVGILKKTSQHDCAGVHNAKRVTIKAPARFQAPSVESVKPKPEVPRRPTKRMRQHLLRREQLQNQMLYQKQLQKQQQEEKELRKQQRQRRRFQRKLENQRALQKQQQQQELERVQHQQELERVQQQLQQHRLKQQQLYEADEKRRKAEKFLEQTNHFNFGKIASSFLDNRDMAKPQSPNRNDIFSYQETNMNSDSQRLQEKLPEVPIKREGNPYLPLYKDSQELGSGSSTITLTTENSQVDCKPLKTPNRSGTSLVDKATNTQIDPLAELLKQVPLRASMDKGASKLNINELLRREQSKGLNADPMCQSLMQLVALMCESKEKQADLQAQNRLRAGSGDDVPQKKYSVYLMVSSEDESDLQKSEGNSSNITGDERTPGEEEEYSQRCANAYQGEYSRLGRRKRTRRRLSSRLDDLDSFSSGPQPFLPMRRPLHWPKQDYSKLSPGRSNRSRTPLRVRSRSSSKQIIQMRRSMGSVLDPKLSWKLWEDLPMTTRTLNKAYSRLWGVSGNQSCTKF